MVLELKDKLEGLDATPIPGLAARPAATLSPLEQDVLSALLNLGCNRAAAEAAVRKAKSTGAPPDFEPLFRRSLELVR
jgi:Holliday junction DNA helicase RuvA